MQRLVRDSRRFWLCPVRGGSGVGTLEGRNTSDPMLDPTSFDRTFPLTHEDDKLLGTLQLKRFRELNSPLPPDVSFKLTLDGCLLVCCGSKASADWFGDSPAKLVYWRHQSWLNFGVDRLSIFAGDKLTYEGATMPLLPASRGWQVIIGCKPSPARRCHNAIGRLWIRAVAGRAIGQSLTKLGEKFSDNIW